MIMQRRDLDPVRPQHAQDRIDLVCDKYEIAGDGGSAVPGWLKVDRGRRAHRRRRLHIAVHQPLGARTAVLVYATGRLALTAHPPVARGHTTVEPRCARAVPIT